MFSLRKKEKKKRKKENNNPRVTPLTLLINKVRHHHTYQRQGNKNVIRK